MILVIVSGILNFNEKNRTMICHSRLSLTYLSFEIHKIRKWDPVKIWSIIQTQIGGYQQSSICLK